MQNNAEMICDAYRLLPKTPESLEKLIFLYLLGDMIQKFKNKNSIYDDTETAITFTTLLNN